MSSKERDLAVIHIAPSFWLRSSRAVRAAALSCLGLGNGTGFTCAFTVPKHVENALSKNARRSGEGLLREFPATANDFREQFELFERMEYGELTIGCAIGSLLGTKAASRTDDFELLFVMARSQAVCWLVSFYADTGDALIVVRTLTQLDALVGKLRESV